MFDGAKVMLAVGIIVRSEGIVVAYRHDEGGDFGDSQRLYPFVATILQPGLV